MSTLTLLTLPIGNPQDITLRGLDELKNKAFFLAEDTREFVKLLRHYGIETSEKTIDSFHDHSSDKLDSLIQKIKNGQAVTLVSEAGSPIISDPAFPLVRAALARGITVHSLPGVSSVLVALELSGLPPHPLHFFGFLPREEERIRELFEQCSRQKGVHLFFESPHRMEKSLQVLERFFPDTELAVARELTKTFETVYRFKASELPEVDIRYQGEFVLCCDFSQTPVTETAKEKKLRELAEEILTEGAGAKRLSKLLSEITGQAPKEIYRILSQ